MSLKNKNKPSTDTVMSTARPVVNPAMTNDLRIMDKSYTQRRNAKAAKAAKNAEYLKQSGGQGSSNGGGKGSPEHSGWGKYLQEHRDRRGKQAAGTNEYTKGRFKGQTPTMADADARRRWRNLPKAQKDKFGTDPSDIRAQNESDQKRKQKEAFETARRQKLITDQDLRDKEKLDRKLRGETGEKTEGNPAGNFSPNNSTPSPNKVEKSPKATKPASGAEQEPYDQYKDPRILVTTPKDSPTSPVSPPAQKPRSRMKPVPLTEKQIADAKDFQEKVRLRREGGQEARQSGSSPSPVSQPPETSTASKPPLKLEAEDFRMGSPASSSTTQMPSDSAVNDDGSLKKSYTIGANNEYRTAGGNFSKGKLDTKLKSVDQSSVDRVQNIRPENTNSTRPSSVTANPLTNKDTRGMATAPTQLQQSPVSIPKPDEPAKMPSYVSSSSDDIKDVDDFSMPTPDHANLKKVSAQRMQENADRTKTQGEKIAYAASRDLLKTGKNVMDLGKVAVKNVSDAGKAVGEHFVRANTVSAAQKAAQERYMKSLRAAEAMRKEGASSESVKKETGINKYGF